MKNKKKIAAIVALTSLLSNKVEETKKVTWTESRVGWIKNKKQA